MLDERAAGALAAAVRAGVDALHAAPPPPNADAGYRAGLRALTAAVVDAPTDAVRQLPSAAREALAVCDDPDAGAAELVRVCEGDLAVARALLREANSVFYMRPGQAPAASLREAIDRVGTGGVRNVLVDVTVSALLCPPGSRHASITAAIWAHAQRTAALARAAAPAFGVSAERAYAAGLLHDVGKLVLLDRAAALAEERSAAPVSWAALRAALVALHEPLGGLAVLRWGMGVEAAGAIAAHHRAPPPETPDAMSEVIYLAERVDHASTRGDTLDLEALWADAALGGVRARAAAALARQLGPITPFAADADGAHAPSRLSRLAGR
ncbi:hypothetical protein tb265_01160 [Gemmatimonadetes bacterium T265]|nr:hypothetical protein tb265_01160 [Gemmatimonadetes bacterium T265]